MKVGPSLCKVKDSHLSFSLVIVVISAKFIFNSNFSSILLMILKLDLL